MLRPDPTARAKHSGIQVNVLSNNLFAGMLRPDPTARAKHSGIQVNVLSNNLFTGMLRPYSHCCNTISNFNKDATGGFALRPNKPCDCSKIF
jgi:hypothetical protein